MSGQPVERCDLEHDEAPLQIAEFLHRMQQSGIRLTVDGDRLACDAPKGAITSELKAELIRRKSDILDFLRSTSAALNASAPVLKPTPDQTEHPLSSGQKRLWFMDQFDDNRSSHNIATALELSGPLDVPVLEASVAELIRRHKTLRTRFVSVEGAPKAVTTPVAGWRLERIDLRLCDKSQKLAKLSMVLREEARKPFSLDTGMLVRGVLLEFDDEDHVLILIVHHIAADGWSVGILLQELSQLYPELLNGRPSPLLELPLEYADFAEWQSKLLRTEKVQSQLKYWRAQLKGTLPVLQLPSDRPRPSKASFGGARGEFKISGDLLQQVREFGRSVQATDFMLLLSAFKLVVYRYTGEKDLIVGSAVAGRTQPELENIVGLFINNLALRTNLAGDPTVRDLVGRVRETCLDALVNQDLPFDTLVSDLRPERNLSHSPIFQVMFVLQNFPMPSRMMGDLTVRLIHTDPGVSRFDLTFEAREEDGGLTVEFEYDTDVLSESTISRIVRDYERVLSAIVSNPDQHLSALISAGPDEVAEILRTNEQTVAEYPSQACIHHLFESTAAEVPDRVAVVCGSENISYRDLSRRSNQIANRLRKLGVGRDSLVGVCLERSIDAGAALLGVLKAGAAYVPMDPHFPQERLAFMVEDAAMQVVLTDEASWSGLNLAVPAVVSLDGDDRAAIENESSVLPDEVAASSDLAYVIFTSGSTGRPKGVQITHRSVVNFLQSMRREPGLTPEDRLISVTTLSFDIAGLEIFLPLTTGARTILASRAVSVDGPELSRLIQDSDATIMQATPATWRLLLESGWAGSKRLKVLCGGEAFPRDLADRLVEICAEVWNLYGPTETTIWSTVHKVALSNGSVPIGKPIANTQIYVLDDQQKPVPQGVPGELYIGGDGVARGYLKRPDLTAAKFVADPFLPGSRMYQTGDLVRYLSNGDLLFIGRNDHQVKIRGFRIELGEIENVLHRCPGVSDAVVIVREDVPGDQRIVGYVVPKPGSTLTSEQLRSSLVSSLPDYMMPSAFVIRAAFPLTPNRKIDRAALPAPDMSTLSHSVAPPTNNHESEVAAIWNDLLCLQRVGIHDNFFDLGGHSLLLVQLQTRLRSQFGREIPILELFQRPTVSGIARYYTGHLAATA